MSTTPSSFKVPFSEDSEVEELMQDQCKNLYSTLPRERWQGSSYLYKYNGFWFTTNQLPGLVEVQKHFQARDSDVLLITTPSTLNILSDNISKIQEDCLEPTARLRYCLRSEHVWSTVWDHVLDYWKASLDKSRKELFLKYEQMTQEPAFYLKLLAQFLGCPISQEEETAGAVDEI
nr:cytosolic sulfotransferase 15-like [Coffea arabica]